MSRMIFFLDYVFVKDLKDIETQGIFGIIRDLLCPIYADTSLAEHLSNIASRT